MQKILRDEIFCELALNGKNHEIFAISKISRYTVRIYFLFHSLSWLDTQEELQHGESQSSTAQEKYRKGGEPSETMLTKETQEMRRKGGEPSETMLTKETQEMRRKGGGEMKNLSQSRISKSPAHLINIWISWMCMMK